MFHVIFSEMLNKKNRYNKYTLVRVALYLLFDRNVNELWGTEVQRVQWIQLLYNNIAIVQLSKRLSKKADKIQYGV